MIYLPILFIIIGLLFYFLNKSRKKIDQNSENFSKFICDLVAGKNYSQLADYTIDNFDLRISNIADIRLLCFWDTELRNLNELEYLHLFTFNLTSGTVRYENGRNFFVKHICTFDNFDLAFDFIRKDLLKQ